MISEEARLIGKQFIPKWRKDPNTFVWDLFKVEGDLWQQEVLRNFPLQDKNKQRQSMQACAGPGKSWALVMCGLNFMTCYADPGEYPKGAVVSITKENLKDNLWAEYAKWLHRSEFLKEYFKIGASRLYSIENPEQHFIAARSFPRKANADEMGRTLSGLHARYVLAQIDESGDINPAILRAAEQALSNCKWGKIQQAGNPTSSNGMLYLSSTSQRHLWDVTSITGDPEDPNRSPRIDIEWAKEQIRLYGRDNPWVMSYILGKFPPGGVNTLLTPDECEESARRKYPESDYYYSQKRIGVDVARFGDDRTVIFPRQGLMAYAPVVMRNARTQQIAGRILLARQRWETEKEYVDGTGGYGAGTCDALYQTEQAAVEVHSSGKPDDPRFFNKRAECYWRLAEWVKRGGRLPNDQELFGELSTITYYYQNGKLRLEEKDQIKKRIGKSPDKADALALTFTEAEMPGEPRDIPKPVLEALSGMDRNRSKEYDPWEDM